MSLFRPTAEQLAELSTQDLAAIAADCLSRLEPGRQPLSLFTQMARLSVQSTVEVVPLRKTTNSTPDVLLAMRDAADPWWPNQWHLPGAVLLPTDEATDVHDYRSPVTSIMDKEFDHTISVTGSVRPCEPLRRKGVRGSEQTVLCWAEVELVDGAELSPNGQFFDIEMVLDGGLGEDLIGGHRENILSALSDYRVTA